MAKLNFVISIDFDETDPSCILNLPNDDVQFITQHPENVSVKTAHLTREKDYEGLEFNIEASTDKTKYPYIDNVGILRYGGLPVTSSSFKDFPLYGGFGCISDANGGRVVLSTADKKEEYPINQKEG